MCAGGFPPYMALTATGSVPYSSKKITGKVMTYLRAMAPAQSSLTLCSYFVLLKHPDAQEADVPDIHFIRGEIEHMRSQVVKQRKEILSLQRAGVSTASAELLLERMLARIDALCTERDRVKAEQPGHNKGKVLGGRTW
jgi:hypothetical protein